MEIATELKDMNSAIMIEYLINLSLPLPEKTILTKEKVGKILMWASSREINKVIRNLEKREILERLEKASNWNINIENLVQYFERVGGAR